MRAVESEYDLYEANTRSFTLVLRVDGPARARRVVSWPTSGMTMRRLLLRRRGSTPTRPRDRCDALHCSIFRWKETAPEKVALTFPPFLPAPTRVGC
jgi:hypothetical protein